MTAVLEIEGVCARRGSVRVIDDVSLSISAGEVVALLGPSGSGKSTLVRILLGLTLPEQGTVRIRGELASIAGKLHVAPEDRDIAVVFQDLALWPHLTAAGNLRFVLRSQRTTRGEEEDRIHAMLEQVGLGGFEKRYPGELSGGEQQRLAIARALVLSPAAVLLDEPLANLDVVMKRELLALLRELFARHRATVVHVTHDPEEAADLASRLVILEAGRTTYAGSLEGVASSESVFGRAVAEALAHAPAKH
ncbi:MAG: ABC transporter ATP-binding protein [Deltaproteobacteria bacterium]|jgi:iron(III) transport system ATP-binding protein